MQEIGKFTVIVGAALILLGLLLIFSNKIPFIGKLPGDILFKRGNFTFYAPIATSILLSIILSLIFYIISRIK